MAGFDLVHMDDFERPFPKWALARKTLNLTSFGHDHPAPVGSFARLDPEPQRTVRNDGDDAATVLIVSAPRTNGYEPMGWA